MPILVKCSECGKSLKAKDELAGKKVKCPGCGNVLAIPTPDDDDPPAKPTRSAPKAIDEDNEERAAPRRPSKPVRQPVPNDEDEGPRPPRSKAKTGQGKPAEGKLQTILGILILIAV